MNRVAHDGLRVRAHAGAASFRRRETLEQLMQGAQAQVQALKLEVGDDPGAGTRRVRAARHRAATEREQRIERAIKAMDEIDKSMAGKSKKRQPKRLRPNPPRPTPPKTRPLEPSRQWKINPRVSQPPSNKPLISRSPRSLARAPPITRRV